jgi:hypothetical protein
VLRLPLLLYRYAPELTSRNEHTFLSQRSLFCFFFCHAKSLPFPCQLLCSMVTFMLADRVCPSSSRCFVPKATLACHSPVCHSPD